MSRANSSLHNERAPSKIKRVSKNKAADIVRFTRGGAADCGVRDVEKSGEFGGTDRAA